MSLSSRRAARPPLADTDAPWHEALDDGLLHGLGLRDPGTPTTVSSARGWPAQANGHPMHEPSLLVRLVLGADDGTLDETLRLGALVHHFVDMHAWEARLLMTLANPHAAPLPRSPEAFHQILMAVIRSRRLHRLFSCGQSGEHHRGIVPGGYSEQTGETFPHEMAAWRADFRALAPEQQMLAATIVWLYRSGPDSTWLRRVPCTWSAVEAIRHLRDTGCVADWLSLLASCPGW